MANRAMSYSDYYNNRDQGEGDISSPSSTTDQAFPDFKKKKKKYDKQTLQRRLDRLRS